MIYAILLIIFIVILATTKATLNRHYGKISDNPLRKKIVDNTVNLILFVIVFWCLLQAYSKWLPSISLLMITFILFLFLHRKIIKKMLTSLTNKLQEKFTFFSTLCKPLKKATKTTKSDSSSKDSKEDRYQSNAIYKEHIMLSVIFFCKRAIIVAIIVLALIKTAESTNPGVLQIILNEATEYLDTLTELFIFINNVGLVFTCWKFNCDYKASESEQVDNPRFIELLKRMLRKEHDI